MTAANAGPCDRGVAGAVRTRPQRPPTHAAGTLAATILGSSLAFIDSSVVNVGLPAIERSIGASGASIAWLINAYMLPLGSLVLFGGVAGDRWGRKRTFLGGMAVFTLASIGCALAPTFALLLAARAAQGLGAAFMMPASLAILDAAFSGTWAAASAVTGALGPFMGGWLVDTVGWRAIFLVNLPLALAAGWLGWRCIDESRSADAAPLEAGGALLATAGLGFLTFALTILAAGETTPVGATAPAVATGPALAALLAGGALLAAFVAVEHRLAAGRCCRPPCSAPPASSASACSPSASMPRSASCSCCCRSR